MKQININNELYSYFIDKSGNVYNKNGRKIKPFINKGYLTFKLRHNGSYKHQMLHRILAHIFIPKVPGFDFVRHLNDDKLDNRICNLAWGDYYTNLDDAVKNGKIKKGSNKPNSKLTDEDVYDIKFNKQKTGTELSNIYNVSTGTISKIKSDKKWSHIK